MALSMKDRLDGLPLSRWHWNVMLICSLGFLFDGMDNMMISFALPVLISTWKLTSRQAGIIGSAGVVGMVIGSFVFGILADYRGRRYVFQTTILVYSLFTGFCALSANWVMLIVFRLIVGTGVGGLIPVDTAYLTEMTPPKYRGKFLSLFNGAWPIGAAVAGLLSYFLVPVFGWRILFVIGVLPALIVFWIRRSLPESPRYLVSRKKFEEAKREIFKIEKRVLGKTSEEEIVFDTNVEQPPPLQFCRTLDQALAKIYNRLDDSLVVSVVCLFWYFYLVAHFTDQNGRTCGPRVPFNNHHPSKRNSRFRSRRLFRGDLREEKDPCRIIHPFCLFHLHVFPCNHPGNGVSCFNATLFLQRSRLVCSIRLYSGIISDASKRYGRGLGFHFWPYGVDYRSIYCRLFC